MEAEKLFLNDNQRQNIQADSKLHYAEQKDGSEYDQDLTELIGMIHQLNIEDPEPCIEQEKNPES